VDTEVDDRARWRALRDAAAHDEWHGAPRGAGFGVDDQLGEHADELIGDLRAGRRPRLIVISGPSGVGKDTLIEQLRSRYPEAYFAVTATTRARRPGEIEGVHYYFMDETTFAERLADEEFLESAVVYGHRYGVLKAPVAAALAASQDVVIKIDVNGAATIRELIPQSISIFLAPESMDSLRERLRYRKTESDDVIARRFEEASRELLRANEFNYIVFNETHGMLKAVQDVRAILQSARMKSVQPEISL
jgi:guanylate kinase